MAKKSPVRLSRGDHNYTSCIKIAFAGLDCQDVNPIYSSTYGGELAAALSYKPADIAALMQRFQDCLPEKPYCTNNLNWGLLIRKRLAAVMFRYIQHNSPFNLVCLVLDIDCEVSDSYWFEHHAPAPNFIVWNPITLHAHFFYMLETPVHLQETAHKGPRRYAAAIDVALTLLLDADQGYSGLICKNPLHESWDVQVYRLNLYTLGELASYLDLTPYKDQRRHLPAIGLGRNCTLFDVTRRWAYRQVRLSGWNKADFTEAVTNYAWGYNEARFPTPLTRTEVKSTARSIAKWTIDTMSEKGFQAWGDARRTKSIYVRQSRSLDRAAEVKALYAEGKTQQQIAAILEISDRQVRTLLNS